MNTNHTIDSVNLGRNGQAPANISLAGDTFDDNICGSTMLPKEAAELADEPIKEAKIDEEYNQRVAMAKGAHGEVDSRIFHIRRAHEVNAVLSQRCQNIIKQLENTEAGYDRHLARLSKQIQRTKPFQQFTEPTEPWNLPARVKVVLYSCIGVGGIGMGITNYVTILQSSGYTLFEQLMRCVIFVFVCALFPVLLELGLGR